MKTLFFPKELLKIQVNGALCLISFVIFSSSPSHFTKIPVNIIGCFSLYFFLNISIIIFNSLKRSFNDDAFEKSPPKTLKQQPPLSSIPVTRMSSLPMTPFTPLFNVKQTKILLPLPPTSKTSFLPNWVHFLKPSLIVLPCVVEDDTKVGSSSTSRIRRETRKNPISPDTIRTTTISEGEKKWNNLVELYRKGSHLPFNSRPTKITTSDETLKFLQIDHPSSIESIRRWFYERIFSPLLNDIEEVEREFIANGVENLNPEYPQSFSPLLSTSTNSSTGLSPMINMISSSTPSTFLATDTTNNTTRKPESYSDLLLKSKGIGIGGTPFEIAIKKRISLEYYLFRVNETIDSRRKLVFRIKEAASGGPLLSSYRLEGKDDSFIITLFRLYMDKNLASASSITAAYSGIHFITVTGDTNNRYNGGNRFVGPSILIESCNNVLSLSSHGPFKTLKDDDPSLQDHIIWSLPLSSSNLPFYAILAQIRLAFVLNSGYLGIGNLSSSVLGLNF